MRSLEEREGPNAGEEYRFRERGSFELPPPSHRYLPLGFLLRVFRGDGVVVVCADGVAKLKLIPFVLANKGEFPRTGVDGVLLVNRKGSGRSARLRVKIFDIKRYVEYTRGVLLLIREIKPSTSTSLIA